MGVWLDVLATSCPTEISRVADQVVYGRARPRGGFVRWMVLVQKRSDPRPGFACCSQLECTLDERCSRRVGHDRPRLPGLHVAERRSEMDPATDRAPLRLLPAFLELATLHSAESQEQGHRELPHGGRWIYPEVNNGNLCSSLVDTLDETKGIGNPSPRKTVEVGHRQTACLTSSDSLQHRLQSRPVELSSRLV